MFLQEILKAHGNVTVAITLEDLKQFSDYLIKKTKEELIGTIAAENEEAFLTVAKVSEMLSVDKSTLYRWSQRGFLKPLEIGGKRMYRMSDIKKLTKAGRTN